MTNVHVPLAVRRYIYAIGIAAAALAVGYGVLDGTQATLWLGLLSALTSTTALAHASDPTPPVTTDPAPTPGSTPVTPADETTPSA